MNKIKILPSQEAQKIAAGEVVERPANIVKELVENALDAGAKTISLYIEKAGKQLIRVVDDGCGMSADDAKLCFSVHATSKIDAIADLLSITTFGFRGEALASISAVSKVELKTRTHDDDLAISVQCSQGEVHDPTFSAAPVGTDISIRDLFYNIPARKKFLKRDETEWNQTQAIFHAFCLSNVGVHFKLFRDSKLVLNAPAVKDVKERASQIWGFNFSQNLVQLSSKTDSWFSCSGYISNHNFWRYGRNTMFFFVNNRWVKNQELSKGILKGYLNVLPPGKFPAVFIFITLNNDHVDFNVHPKKEEVRFTKPVTIQNALQESVKETLQQNLNAQVNLAPRFEESVFIEQSVAAKNPEPERIILPPKKTFDVAQDPFASTPVYPPVKTFTKQAAPIHTDAVFISQNIEKIEEKQSLVEEKNSIEKDQLSGKIFGQLFNTYIIIDQHDQVVFVDQHAAHERIMYERFLKNFDRKDGIALLFPVVLKLSEDQLKLILEHQEFFANQGITIEEFGKTELAIKSSPPKVKDQCLKELMLEAIEFIQENEQLDQELFRKKFHEHMHSQIACKSAVRAGDLLDMKQMIQLIEDLQKTENRFICAHGRPTTWTITKSEFEKKFRRC